MSFIRKMLEKLLGQFHEGPNMPERLSNMVLAFANANPKATRMQWVEFAKMHSEVCYNAGYTRGEESSERVYKEPETAPEVIADAIDPEWRNKVYDWRWGTVQELKKPEVVPSEEHPSDYDPLLAQLELAQAIKESVRKNKSRM